MEASEQSEPTTKRKKARSHVEYVALIQNGGEPGVNGWELISHTEGEHTGEPVIWHAYRATDVVSDVIDEGIVEPDDQGKTPFVVAVPARSWRPQRATVATRRQISLSTD
jgi:hypothetical protein